MRYLLPAHLTIQYNKVIQKMNLEARPAFKCLGVSCRGTGQQRPATGTGVLPAADLGHAVCGISPLGGGRHQPQHRATKHTTHKLQNNYTKEISHC